MRLALQAKKTAKQIRHDLKKDIKEIRNAVRDVTMDVKGKANEITQRAIEKARAKSLAARDTAEDYIHEKPFKTVGVALLVGYVLGLFMRK